MREDSKQVFGLDKRDEHGRLAELASVNIVGVSTTSELFKQYAIYVALVCECVTETSIGGVVVRASFKRTHVMSSSARRTIVIEYEEEEQRGRAPQMHTNKRSEEIKTKRERSAKKQPISRIY